MKQDANHKDIVLMGINSFDKLEEDDKLVFREMLRKLL